MLWRRRAASLPLDCQCTIPLWRSGRSSPFLRYAWTGVYVYVSIIGFFLFSADGLVLKQRGMCPDVFCNEYKWCLQAEWPRAIEELTSFPHIEEAAVLSTCNRMELYVVALSWHRVRRKLFILVPCCLACNKIPWGRVPQDTTWSNKQSEGSTLFVSHAGCARSGGVDVPGQWHPTGRAPPPHVPPS